MTIEDLRQHTVGILGFGQEGQAVLSYLQKHDINATVFSESINTTNTFSNATFITGEHYLDTIAQCSVLFRSPGVWRKHPKILDSESNGTLITSQTKFFFENTTATIIGITGTKGKGTTSSLIYETARAAHRTVYLTGNIGKIQPLEFIDDTKPGDLVVYELSSFQLQDLTVSPHIGVCLMVTSDHLNHHADLAEYHEAKSSIVKFQTSSDIAIYNADYPHTQKIGLLGNGEKYIVSAKDEPEHGAHIVDDSIILTGLENQTETIVIDCAERNLRGKHNLENIAAAALASHALGISIETITSVSTEFAGLEHRLQYVGTFNDVAYFNDSISTVPETTLAALNAFSENTHLLLGGSDKGLDYNDLIKALAKRNNLASITLLGEVGHQLHKTLSHETQTALYGPYDNFEEAIKNVKSIVQPKDIVLLSPASASFDMFKNYADRGQQFVALVSEK